MVLRNHYRMNYQNIFINIISPLKSNLSIGRVKIYTNVKRNKTIQNFSNSDKLIAVDPVQQVPRLQSQNDSSLPYLEFVDGEEF